MKELTVERRKELAELISSSDIESVKLGIELLKTSEDYKNLQYKIVYYIQSQNCSYPILLKDLLDEVTFITYNSGKIFIGIFIGIRILLKICY